MTTIIVSLEKLTLKKNYVLKSTNKKHGVKKTAVNKNLIISKTPFQDKKAIITGKIYIDLIQCEDFLSKGMKNVQISYLLGGV